MQLKTNKVLLSAFYGKLLKIKRYKNLQLELTSFESITRQLWIKSPKETANDDNIEI